MRKGERETNLVTTLQLSTVVSSIYSASMPKFSLSHLLFFFIVVVIFVFVFVSTLVRDSMRVYVCTHMIAQGSRWEEQRQRRRRNTFDGRWQWRRSCSRRRATAGDQSSYGDSESIQRARRSKKSWGMNPQVTLHVRRWKREREREIYIEKVD